MVARLSNRATIVTAAAAAVVVEVDRTHPGKMLTSLVVLLKPRVAGPLVSNFPVVQL